MGKNELDSARTPEGQKLLFPLSPEAVCEQIALDWWTAIKLRDSGWLSFDPALTRELDEAQETELRFVGALVCGGCDPILLERLLGKLSKPYSYQFDRIYYDWPGRRWRLLPELDIEPAAVLSEWIEELKENSDLETLECLAAEIEAAISTVKPPQSGNHVS